MVCLEHEGLMLLDLTACTHNEVKSCGYARRQSLHVKSVWTPIWPYRNAAMISHGYRKISSGSVHSAWGIPVVPVL